VTFKEDLEDALKKEMEKKAAHEQAGRDFAANWDKYRFDKVLPILKEAAEAITKITGKASRADRNNGGVKLEAALDSYPKVYPYTLHFAPDHEQRIVICSSSFSSAAEPYKLEALDRAAIENEAKKFSQALVYV
jgi:hypothetical protein